MHVPDGFVDGSASLACGAAAATGVAVAVRRAATDLDDRRVPLAGMVAAYVFAVQMVNFPVAAGTSGHLLGGALAAVLVGPWVAALCLTVVLAVQALVFADGGLSALGVNVLLMAFVATFVGYGVHVVTLRLLPSSDRSVAVAAGVGAWCSVVAASAAFVAIYAVGGTGDVALGAVGGAMIGVHGLIGVGEAVITFLTVGTVVAARPDLVFAGRSPAETLRPAVAGGRS